MRPERQKFPTLAKAWDDYGHAIPFDQLDGIKFNGYYAVVRWKDEGDDEVQLADLAWDGESWQMNNDGMDPITEDEWKRLVLVPDCDYFRIEEPRRG